MNSIRKNLGLQTVYQVLSVCLPLITAPYLARKLGAPQLGVFSYPSSIVMYFTLAAMLGTINYGTRSIASVNGSRRTVSTVFSGIYALQMTAAAAASALYVVYLVFFCTDNRLIAWLQGIALISCFFDISWLFFGVEDFQTTVLRSMAVKVSTVVLILLLVKKESDLWIYTLIMLGGNLLSNLVLFLYLPRYASFVRVSGEQIREHLRPNLVLFVPLLAMTVYHTMDKTMLGMLSTYEESGFYYCADKLVQMPLVVISGAGTVMLPRMSALLAEKRQEDADELFLVTLEGVAAVSIALACGIAAVSREFIPFFFGAGYEPCVALTLVFSPVLFFKGFSVIVRTQYLIPMKLESEFTKSVAGGAALNLVLNLVLIPGFGALGAAAATAAAEVFACFLQFYSIRDRGLGLTAVFRKSGVYLLMGLLMICLVRAAALTGLPAPVKLLSEIAAGACFYGLACLLYWKKTESRFYEFICRPLADKRGRDL